MSRVRLIKRKSENNSDEMTAATQEMNGWQKACPSCHALQHARKKECDCGHTFAVRARPLTDEENLNE